MRTKAYELFCGVGPARHVRVTNAVFRHDMSMDDFAMCLNSMAAELLVLRENIDEAYIMKKLVCIVPSKMEQGATSIDMFLDLDRVEVEELVGRLRVAEGKHGGEAAVVDNDHMQLLLTGAVGSMPMSRAEKE